MENVMTKGFCELNEQEMMEVEGGVDGAMWAKGCKQALAGIGGCIASAVVTVVQPQYAPVTTITFGAGAVMYTEGAKNMYNAFFY